MSFIVKINPRHRLAFCCFSFVFILSCNTKVDHETVSSFDPAFATYISSYTSGVISSNGAIRVMLSEADRDSNSHLRDLKLFRLSPEVNGSAIWMDRQTVEFRPSEPLASGQQYQVFFSLASLYDVPQKLAEFSFPIQVIKQDFSIELNHLYTADVTDLTRQKLEGLLQTADLVDPEKLEEALTVLQSDKKLPVTWTHSSDGLEHRFLIDQIIRGEKPSEIQVDLDGASMGVASKQQIKVEVPALGDFELMNAKVMPGSNQHIVLQFSDPLKEKQNLDGLIRLGDLSNLQFDIQGHEIMVYPDVRQTDSLTLYIEPGIRNISDQSLKKSTSVVVRFEQLKPAVRFTGKGNILPGASELVLPFEAVGLTAVDVQIIKIFEQNIFQFLQANQLDGSNELRRVGKVILKKMIKLDNSGLIDYEKWNRYTLDLTSLMQTEPGAIYQVRISFKQPYSTFYCDGQKVEDTPALEDEEWDEPDNNEFSYWDSYDENYYNSDYDWRERDNPCHSSYYTGSRNISKNILASDLGIIAKRGGDNELTIFVNDIRETSPLANVRIDVYNFQRQLLASAQTDGEGKAVVDNLAEKPFLIMATSQDQKGYLRIDDGSSLSLSSFDVSGKTVEAGIKGFIYGDRGVWRPGDSLHISFILEDRNKVLPASHPVIFELLNPLDQIIERQVRTSSLNGFYYFGAQTNPEAITGNYQARLQVGSAHFTKLLKVETVKPNRLRLDMSLENDRIGPGKNNIRGQLNVQWLHGAPARNLMAEMEVVISRNTEGFSQYPDFTFDDPTIDLYSDPMPVLKERLDQNGRLDINTSLPDEGMVPGMMNASFRTKVFEEGGDFSVNRFTFPYYAFPAYMGIRTPKGDQARNMLLTDTAHRVDIVRVDQNGNANGDHPVKVEVYKLNWTWWWENAGNSNANYINSAQNEPIQQETLNLKNGKGTWVFKIDYPDWGRYLIRVCDPATGHCAGKVVYVDWPGWAGRAQREGADGATMLTVSSEKGTYRIGEEAVIQIPGSEVGRALVSVENGSKILQSWWVTTQSGDTPFRFMVTPEMSPNVYISVTLLQKHAQTINDLPIRMYGVIPIQVEDPGTHLEPVITMSDELHPGKEVVIKVSESNRREMTYTLAMVDEGLLDLTRFKTPDPWNYFYAREALGVRTWDLYDQVIGAYGSTLERLLAVGGDQSLIIPKDSDIRAQRFKPVVKFLGPFTLEGGQTNTHKFIMSEYIGSVRTMVVAAAERAYGQAEKTSAVRDPLMVLGTLPRVLSPGEDLRLPVTLFAGEASIRNASVQVNVSGPLKINGPSRQQVAFSDASDLTTYFDLNVNEATGIGRVTIEATSGSFKSQYDIEVEVRNPFLPLTKVIDGQIDPGASWATELASFGLPGSNHAVLEISGIPPLNLEARLAYLISYPHGCLEQTISAGFPQLYLSQLHELDQQESQSIQKNVNATIEKVVRLQFRDGGFQYWPGASHADDWSTTYAGHFLVEAEHKGYVVPSDIIRKWKRFQKTAVTGWKKNPQLPGNDLMQAYRLYSLALAGAPEKAAMNLLRETPGLQKQASWMLAATYAVIGQMDAANQLVNRMNLDVEAYEIPGITYGSSLRDQAILLETLTLLEDKSSGIDLLQEISRSLANNDLWMSTQTTAFCLKAVANFMKNLGEEDKVLFRYALDAGNLTEISTDLPIASIPLNLISETPHNLKVENTSKGTLFARVMITGTPISIEDDIAIERNLRMQLTNQDAQGNSIDINQLEQGNSFYATVSIQHLGLGPEYKDLALSQIFPSGWEINNTRIDEVSGQNVNVDFDYQDIRDDRVLTYFDLKPGEKKTLKVMVTAAYAGEYYYPGPSCEAMYDHNVQARVKGKKVKVISSKVVY